MALKSAGYFLFIFGGAVIGSLLFMVVDLFNDSKFGYEANRKREIIGALWMATGGFVGFLVSEYLHDFFTMHWPT